MKAENQIYFRIFIILLLLLSTGFFLNKWVNRGDAPVETLTHKQEHPLQTMMEGNLRFTAHAPMHPDESTHRMLEVAKGQHPFAVVVCCSDSRVSPELIFDQGLGDLFVIRTAGNVLGGIEIGSIEYAVEHLGVHEVMVMGHESCGAVSAMQSGEIPHGHIKEIIDSLKNEAEIRLVKTSDPLLLQSLIKANALHGIHQLQSQSAIIQEKLHERELTLTAAYYDLHSGEVSILEETPSGSHL